MKNRFFLICLLGVFLLACTPAVFADDSTSNTATTTVTSVLTATSTESDIALVATTTAVSTTTTPTALIATSTQDIATSTPVQIILNTTQVQAQVQSYFADTPIMISVARCESSFRQFADSGNVFRGGDGTMIGVFQISETAHRAIALSMGLDINTLAGNMAYAKYLYGLQGTVPWLASFSCWNDRSTEGGVTATSTISVLSATSSPVSSGLTLNLVLGMIDPQVLTLQKILNSTGFAVASSGPGSPGNETNKFGSLTRDAVRRFQCAKQITCSGDEYSTGYGFVGPLTRTQLLNMPLVAVTFAPMTTNTPVVPAQSGSAQTEQDTPQILALKAQIVLLEQQVAVLQAQLQKQLAMR